MTETSEDREFTALNKQVEATHRTIGLMVSIAMIPALGSIPLHLTGQHALGFILWWTGFAGMAGATGLIFINGRRIKRMRHLVEPKNLS